MVFNSKTNAGGIMDPFINDTPDIFRRMIQNWKNAQNFCSIGKVVAINSAPVSVNVQPLVKYYDNITRWEDYPVLLNVPVSQIAGPLYSIRTPLNVGDTGIIIWVDREIYTCLLSGASTTTIPDTGDTNDQNSCIFIPTIQSFGAANMFQNRGVDIVSSGQSLLTQLLNLLTDLTNLLTDLTTFSTALITAGSPYAGAPTAPVLGAYPIAVSAACVILNSSIATVGTAITAVKTALTTFKGAQP